MIIPFTGEIITAAIRRPEANYFWRCVREIINLFSPLPVVIFASSVFCILFTSGDNPFEVWLVPLAACYLFSLKMGHAFAQARQKTE